MTVLEHSDWQLAGFAGEPLADAVGPFPRRPLLEAWWNIRGSGSALFVEASDAFFAAHRVGDEFRLLGEPDLFDYHSPLGVGVAALVADWAAGLSAGLELDFDSLPAEAADAFMTGFAKAGLAPVAEMHETTAVLELPGDYEEYLAGLDKKQRHETRRKGRRFTELLGSPRLERESGPTAVARFVAMHRLAEGSKGAFMTEDMAAFFTELHAAAGAAIDFLYGDDDTPVAAAFGFEDEDAYYLYNSAYQPSAGAASPGIVLVAELIRNTIETGYRRFDFLKGDEVYKYRLGAVARPLWRIRATVEVEP